MKKWTAAALAALTALILTGCSFQDVMLYLYGGIATVKGTAIGAITYEFNGPGWHVDEFLRELAANSDVIDFGTAAKPVAYAEDRAHDPLAADTATAPAASAAAHEGANA